MASVELGAGRRLPESTQPRASQQPPACDPALPGPLVLHTCTYPPLQRGPPPACLPCFKLPCSPPPSLGSPLQVRRLGDFSVVDEAGIAEPVESVDYSKSKLFLSGGWGNSRVRCDWLGWDGGHWLSLGWLPCPKLVGCRRLQVSLAWHGMQGFLASGQRCCTCIEWRTVPSRHRRRLLLLPPQLDWDLPLPIHLALQAWCTPRRVPPTRRPAGAASALAPSSPSPWTSPTRRWCRCEPNPGWPGMVLNPGCCGRPLKLLGAWLSCSKPAAGASRTCACFQQHWPCDPHGVWCGTSGPKLHGPPPTASRRWWPTPRRASTC